MRAANTPEEEKSEVITYNHIKSYQLTIHFQVVKRTEAHLLLATKARSYLKDQVKAAKDAVKSHFTDRGLAIPPIGASLGPKCNDITMHFSFDFAQQASYHYTSY